MKKNLIYILSNLGVHIGHSIQETKSENISTIKGIINNTSIIDLQLTVFYLKRNLFFIQKLGSISGNILFYSSNIHNYNNHLKSYLINLLVFKEKQSFFSEKWKNGCFSNYKTQVIDILNMIDFLDLKNQNTIKKKRISPKGYRIYLNKTNRVTQFKKYNFLKFRMLHWLDFLIQIIFVKKKKKIVGLNWYQEWKRINKYWRFYYYFKFYNNFLKWPDLCVLTNHLNRDSIVSEINRKKIPTIGLLDSNTKGTGLSYYIPSNDDSFLILLFYFRLFINSYKQGNLLNMLK